MYESRQISTRNVACATINMDLVFLCMYMERVMLHVNESCPYV